MELWQQILDRAKKIEHIDEEKYLCGVLSSACYVALERIKEIIEDSSLEDDECFMQIENIVVLFETLGSDCGVRHDF